LKGQDAKKGRQSKPKGKYVMRLNAGLIGAGVSLIGAAAFAQEPSVRYDANAPRPVVVEEKTTTIETSEPGWRVYKANELNFSFFGTGTVGKNTFLNPSERKIRRDGRLGAGAGLQYFLHRNIGIEGYAYTENTDNNFIDNVGGNLIGRFPIANSGLAPYIFGGGGRQLDPLYQWVLDAGAGIEFRFSPHVGIFVDGQYVWADKTEDYGLGRAGLRVGF
jgi:hypothetical protein